MCLPAGGEGTRQCFALLAKGRDEGLMVHFTLAPAFSYRRLREKSFGKFGVGDRE